MGVALLRAVWASQTRDRRRRAGRKRTTDARRRAACDVDFHRSHGAEHDVDDAEPAGLAQPLRRVRRGKTIQLHRDSAEGVDEVRTRLHRCISRERRLRAQCFVRRRLEQRRERGRSRRREQPSSPFDEAALDVVVKI